MHSHILKVHKCHILVSTNGLPILTNALSLLPMFFQYFVNVKENICFYQFVPIMVSKNFVKNIRCISHLLVNSQQSLAANLTIMMDDGIHFQFSFILLLYHSLTKGTISLFLSHIGPKKCWPARWQDFKSNISLKQSDEMVYFFTC